MAHIINNFASIIFGFVFIAIWTGILTGKDEANLLNVQDMTYYVAFTQCLLWLSVFLTPGLGLQDRIRTGAISLDMIRPVNLYLLVISQEIGRILYNAIYRSFFLAILFWLVAHFYVPTGWVTAIWALLSLFFAIWIGLNLSYIIGISSIWTIEIEWAHLVYISCVFGLGGQFVPLVYLPEGLSNLISYLPFACMIYYPVMFYLEKLPFTPLLIQGSWAVILTLVSIWLTHQTRKYLEIQGG
nr:ABC-2 family transporter protein [Polycladospora coralii]